MGIKADSALRLCAAVALLISSAPLAAQQRTSTVAAGPQYAASPANEVIFGGNWRVLWTTPVTVPYLDLNHAGGLKPIRQGGRQSYTLHFEGADGKRYVFRSVDKFLHKEALPPDIRHTPVGWVIQDNVSAMFPAPGVMMAPVFRAVGVLYSPATLVRMPDDPRLGEHRARFAGMLGQFEENPNEGKDGAPGFAGSRIVLDTDDFLERMDESPRNRFAATEYLAARLISFLVGDTDRGGDQWKFAGFGSGQDTLWRPVPRDMDWAFMRPAGVFGMVAKKIYTKTTGFDQTFPSLARLTLMTVEMDRRFLVELPRARWDSVVLATQRGLTDELLATALRRMPAEYQPHALTTLYAGLRARRDALPEIAAEFYDMVAREAVVYGTAADELGEVFRNPDGSVDVRLFHGPAAVVALNGASPAPGDMHVRAAAGASSAPYFTRRFLPGETREIRVYMEGGNDRVIVRGSAQRSILVRVIGGDGADILADSSQVAGGTATVFYLPDRGDVALTGAGTRVDGSPYQDLPGGRPEDLAVTALREREAQEGKDTANLVDRRLRGAASGDWGSRFGIGPTADYRGSVGVLVGASLDLKQFGFRRDPYKYRVTLDALYGIEANRLGLELYADYHPENSRMAVDVEARATQLEAFRFFGYGNATPRSEASARVYRDEVLVKPALYWAVPELRIGGGPVFRTGKTTYATGSPMDQLRPLGTASFSQVGAHLQAELDRPAPNGVGRALGIDVGGTFYPALLDVPEPFGEAHAGARLAIPIASGSGPFIAMRAGAQHVWGAFPVHDAVFIGGRRTLRGYTTDRFAGDAAVYGSTELHAPLGTVELLTRGRLGVFGLADAGRVYVDGASPGGWHTAWGGGLWFATLGRAVSLTYARGEAGRFYIDFGLPIRP